MSSLFELDDEGWNRRVEDARAHPADTQKATEPGFFSNAIGGAVSGAMRGFTNLNDALLTATDLVVPMSDAEHAQQEDLRKNTLDFWRPDMHTTGAAGRLLGGVAEGLAPLTLGVPGAVASNTLAAGKAAVDENVDSTTAGEAAALGGLSTYAGLKIPFFGGTLAKKIASGAAGNFLFGAADAEANKLLFEKKGYADLAQNYNPLDVESRAVDLLLGAAFGAHAHLLGRMPPSARDAVLTAANAKHYQVDTAPGIPQDLEAQQAHTQAMNTAADQMLRGEPVSVSPAVAEANFAPKRSLDELDLHDAMKEIIGEISPDESVPMAKASLGDLPAEKATPVEESTAATQSGFTYEPGHNLKPEQSAIEQRFGEDIGRDVKAAERRYAELEDSRGGKVLNVDTARELSPDYLKDRTQSASVHEPASALIKQIYAQKLAEAPKPGETPTVLFTAGGTGAGKTTAIKNALGKVADQAQIVYDTNMNGVQSSIQKIDQALTAGKNVTIVYTYRDPIMALKAGALPRAMRQEAQFGSGRTVPVDEHLRTHLGSRASMEHIAAHYAGDSRVQVLALDNSRGQGQVKAVKLGSIPKFEPDAYNQLREHALTTLEEERAAGRISDAVYRGFAADASAAHRAVARGVEPGGSAGARGEPQPQRAQGSGPERVAFEPTSGSAPKPGTPFLVARLGSSGKLDNRNAGNAQSVADFLARTGDPNRPQPVGANKSDTLYVYQLKAPKEFGKYELGSKGKAMEGETIGRKATSDGVSYSFPAAAKVDAEPVLKISMDELRADVKRRTGTDDFDELGSIAGGKALEAVIAERLAPTQVVATATGRKLEVRPRLMEMSELLTSDKADYPKELQPRQRGARKALDEQVQSIAKNLDPARLGASAEADRGSPITGDGNVVESGNGRVMALKYAYENLPEKAQEYRKFLESQGYDLGKMKEPVLVRERVTPLSAEERRAFTVEANQAATAALSPVERAQADARILDAAALSRLRGGDIASVQNSDFVRGFLEQLPQAERNALVNPDGSVSQEGVRRIQAALLAKAYGGKPESNATLGRMLESTDPDMRSALGAMLDAAPAFARLRQSIIDGKISGEYDISGALTEAVENVARLRNSGQSLRDFLAQGDMLTQRAPIVDELMKALYDKTGTRIAGREKIAAALTKYAGQAARQRLDQGSLFAEAPQAPDKLLAESTAEEQAPKVSDMFGLRTPQGGAMDAARQVLEVQDVPVATGAVDADGNPIIRSGRQVMAEAQAEITKAENDSKGFEAAVNCFIGRGQDAA